MRTGLKWHYGFTNQEETMNSKTIRNVALTLALSLGAGNAIAEVEATTDAADETRVSESSFFSEGRGQTAPDRVATQEFEGVPRGAARDGVTRGSEQQKLEGNEAQSPNTDFWFYSADIELFADDDRDGYYHGIDLWFDADTIYFSADVYAVVYLSLEGGPWIEYAETETFSIFGASGTDDYVVVTELLSGYPTGSYDVLIELFDAWDNSFVADLGPESTSELAFLPLEDAGRDVPFSSSPPIAVSRGGGGAADLVTLAVFALLAAAALTRRQRRPISSDAARRGPSA